MTSSGVAWGRQPGMSAYIFSTGGCFGFLVCWCWRSGDVFAIGLINRFGGVFRLLGLLCT